MSLSLPSQNVMNFSPLLRFILSVGALFQPTDAPVCVLS